MRSSFFLLSMFFLILSGCGRQNYWNHDGPLVWEEKISGSPRPQIPEREMPEKKSREPKIAPPKLAEPKTVTRKKIETIVIDAGHGGKDTGTQSEKNHYQEKNLTLLTVRLLQKYLEEMGYKTFLTRDADTFVELTSRAHLANSIKADLFVSVHYNYCQSPEVEGIEVFYYKGDKNPPSARQSASKSLGQEVLAKIVKHTGAQSRGMKTANFAVIRETKMPAILIEAGFLSNPQERDKIKDPEYRCYLAYAIARGVDGYLSSHRK